MTSKERMLTTILREEPDRAPLYAWMFGFSAPEHLRWQEHDREVPHWYTMRLEHIHTLPEPWSIAQDFRRVERVLGLGLDDVLEVSVPWSLHPDVDVRDWQEPPSGEEPYPLLCRAYRTPAGVLRHRVRRTEESPRPGWVIQPPHPKLFEDFNIPRGVEHAVSGPEDLSRLRYLLQDPRPEQLGEFRERMAQVRRFADEKGVMVQGWSAFGMDGIVWLCGIEEGIMTAVEHPVLFQELVDLMYDFDRRRTEILLDTGGVDMVVQRGWYSSTDFWSPALFRRFVLPSLKELVAMVHQAGALFAYVMTTGIMAMLEDLCEAGIDLLYFVDPVQDNVDLIALNEALRRRFAVAGGMNSGITLGTGTSQEVREAVRTAMETLGSGGGFILSPVDALFPDTPWENVHAMIEAWREFR